MSHPGATLAVSQAVGSLWVRDAGDSGVDRRPPTRSQRMVELIVEDAMTNGAIRFKLTPAQVGSLVAALEITVRGVASSSPGGVVKPITVYREATPRHGASLTHDYTVRHWGHDYTFQPIDSGRRGKMMGFGLRVSAGDYLLLADADGNSTRYQVERIQYYQDPPDQWRADVVFAPRSAPEGT